MRHRFLSCCMVFLLALRGLLGGAMAMDMSPLMATSQPGAASASHHTSDTAAATSEHHLPLAHTTTPAGTPEARQTAAPAHCALTSTEPVSSSHCQHSPDGSPCSSCLLCHAPCCPWEPVTFNPQGPAGAMPQSVSHALTSAPARTLTKPPMA